MQGPGALGVVTQLVVIGTLQSGIFVYNGNPARGTLVISLVSNSAVTTDGHGNNVLTGLTIGTWDPATGNRLANIRINLLGQLFVNITNGQTQILLDVTRSLFEVFNSSGEGFNNLIASIASAGGTDESGNAFLAGITSRNGTGTIYANLLNGILTLVNLGHTYTVGLDSVNNQLNIIDAGDNLKLFITPQGNILTVVPNHPGTPNTAEGWNLVAPNFAAGWGVASFGFAPAYRLESVGAKAQVRLRGNAAATASHATSSTIFTLPAAYVPSGGTTQFYMTVSNAVGIGFPTGTIAVDASGNVICNGAINNTQFVGLDNIVIPLD